MIWFILGVMLFCAALIVVWPIYRAEKRISVNVAGTVLIVMAITVSVYSVTGNPTAQSTQSDAMPSVDEMVASLAARLEQNPEDLAGWKMLGRSYVQLRRFPDAIKAFERAVELESNQNGQTLADLGEAILLGDGRTLAGRAGALFENALAISPNNPKALFYAGMAAVERGDNELGATRWEALLATSPPENIADILRDRIAELRGEAPPAPVQTASTGVAVNVTLGDAVVDKVQPGQTVFIIARDPAQPRPPIAAVRRQVADLPAEVSIADSDAMIPGRVPSAFSELEIVARVSMSGQPIAQSGDWFGQEVISTAESGSVNIVINQQVP